MEVYSELRQAQLEVIPAGQAPSANKKGLISYKDAMAPMEINDGTDIHKVLTDKMYPDIRTQLLATNIPYNKVDKAPVAFLSEQTSPLAGSGDFNSGSWVKRNLNNETDASGIVTLASGAFTLDAGTYRIEASAPAFAVNHHQTRLRNTTDSTTVASGTSEYADASSFGQSRSVIDCEVTIAGTKTFELQHLCANTKTANGLGACGLLSTDADIYSTVKITRVA